MNDVPPVSANYRLLNDADNLTVLYSSWKHSDIPLRQWQLVSDQLSCLAGTHQVFPFTMLQAAASRIGGIKQSALEIGCSSGYNSHVLQSQWPELEYHGIDYSPAFIDFARTAFPRHEFSVADAAHLPFDSASFTVVLDGGCLLHVPDPVQCISEAFRVSSRYVIYHRVSITSEPVNTYWVKEAYGVPVAETAFNRSWLEAQFSVHGRILLWTGDLDSSGSGSCTYLLEKKAL